jgi:acyl-CoA-dependent ceramide synthase
MLRYLAYRRLCDATFVWFLLSWLVTRHVLFNFVIWSVYAHLPRSIAFAWDPERANYFTKEMWIGFFSMLLALQVRLLQVSSPHRTDHSIDRSCK